jgi:hypothetical protein
VAGILAKLANLSEALITCSGSSSAICRRGAGLVERTRDLADSPCAAVTDRVLPPIYDHINLQPEQKA